MKTFYKIGLVTLMIVTLLVSVSAINLIKEDLDLDYTSVQLSAAETVDAFKFSTSGDFSIGGIDIAELVAVFDGAQAGLYYKMDAVSDYQFLSLPDFINYENLEINNADFVIYQHTNLRELGIEEGHVTGLTSSKKCSFLLIFLKNLLYIRDENWFNSA